MTYDPVDFSKNLIKGRIAETIFEQMFRDAGNFTVLTFGYETILPELAHRQNDMHAGETMEIIRHAPDFAVIDNKTHEVYLVEVKYLEHPETKWTLPDAQLVHDTWKPAYLFFATPKGFYLDKASEIVFKEGVAAPLSYDMISKEIQDRYVNFLKKFIPPNSVSNLEEVRP